MASSQRKYSLGKSLGHGGFAEVFEATTAGENGKVAFKRLKPDNSTKLDHRARLEREIRSMISLNHPNIMQILDYDREHFSWYTMQIAETSLKKLSPPLHEAVVQQVLKDCLSALIAVHANGQLHRDIKPSNILKIGDGDQSKWVLADFGLITALPDESQAGWTETNENLGTRHYAAPETYNDPTKFSEKADIYSLGKTLEWMLTGTTNNNNLQDRWNAIVKVATSDSADLRYNANQFSQVITQLNLTSQTPSLDEIVNRIQSETTLSPELIQSYWQLVLTTIEKNEKEAVLEYVVPVRENQVLATLSNYTDKDIKSVIDMVQYTLEGSWEGSFDDLHKPLLWLLDVAISLNQAQKMHLANLAMEFAISQDKSLDRWTFQRRLRSYLTTLPQNEKRNFMSHIFPKPGVKSYLLDTLYKTETKPAWIR